MAIVLPANRRKQMITSYTTDVTREMNEQVLRRFQTDDPGLLAIVGAFVEKTPALVNDTMEAMLPAISDLIARAHAQQYTREELSQILAFGQTPIGAKFLCQVNDLWKGPEVQTEIYRQKRAMESRQTPLMNEFISSVGTYLYAHRNVAVKLDKQGAN